MSKLYFKEIQRFNSIWMWLLNLAVIAILAFVLVQEYIMNKETGVNKEEYWFFLFLLIPVGVLFLFYMIRMETEVRRDGIYFRFFPFIRKFKMIRWEDMKECYVRTYRPVAEYGGWGIRTGWKKKSVAYNVRGRTGLQIVLKNGRSLLLGTQQGKELEEILKKINTGE